MKLFLLLPLLAALLAACNINTAPRPIVSPTTERQAPPTVPPSATATVPATATAPPTPLSASPTAQATTAAPTATLAPPTSPATATAPYFEYVVQEGETLLYIIQLPQHGYGYEPDVAATAVALTDGLRSADAVRVGQTIRIPRPTLTPTAVGAAATQALLATIGADDSSGAILPQGSAIGCHEVVANDTMVSIAVQNSTTLEILSTLNRDVNWFGCNFTEPSGGENCNPLLDIGQCVRVPLPPPTATEFPTPTGNETATPLPTKSAPRLLYPAAGASVPPGSLTLQWLSLSGMQPAEVYLIELIELMDQSDNQQYRWVTSATAFTVPAELAPPRGQTRALQWRVSVAQETAPTGYAYAGALGAWHSFQWRGS